MSICLHNGSTKPVYDQMAKVSLPFPLNSTLGLGLYVEGGLNVCFYRCSDGPNVSRLHVLSSCLMIDKDRNENAHVFSSLVTFNCTFISHMKV